MKMLKFAALLTVLLFSGCESVKEAMSYDGPDVTEERKIEDQKNMVKDARFPNTPVVGAGTEVK